MFGFSFINTMTEEEKAEWDMHIEEKIATQEACAQKRIFQNSGIGERFFQESFDTYVASTEVQKKMLEDMKLFVRNVNAGKFATVKLLGTVGTGKTHLAAAVLRETEGIYRVSDAILNEVKEAERYDIKDDKEHVINRYVNTPFLVIDEIGRSDNAERERHVLYRIINGRYEKRLPTMLISNFDKVKFAEHVGAAITDRLNESCITYELTWASYRTKKREELSRV